MTRKERAELKQALRDSIGKNRHTILTFFNTSTKIPKEVVDGKLSLISDFLMLENKIKNNKNLRSLYEPVESRASLNNLSKVNQYVEGLVKKFHIPNIPSNQA